MSVSLRLAMLAVLAFISITGYAIAIPPASRSNQRFISNDQPRDCSQKIQASFARTYQWDSPQALSLAQCLISHSPQPNKCIFYTREARELAIQYAIETDRTTIYDVYSPRYFNTSILPAKRWKESGHLRDLFRITSKAYAIACSGDASLVMPEDEEPCPSSIWITDEYDAIRNGLSRIELPVWRVSWSLDREKGTWNWMRKVLSAAIGGDVKVGGRQVKRSIQESATTTWGQIQDQFVEPVAEDVSGKLQMMKEQWGWSAGSDIDTWAVLEGRCDRPQI